MARIQFTGTGQLYLLTTMAGTAPKVAEITAGVRLTPLLRQDGLNRSKSGTTVDVADADDLWDKTDIGTSGGTLEMTFYRDSVAANDIAWTALPAGTRGWIIVMPFGGSGTGTPKAPIAGDRCEVWQIAVIDRAAEQIQKNGAQLFKVMCAIPSAPNEDALVLA